MSEFDKEYEIKINTTVIFDFKHHHMPEINSLLMAFAKILTEKGWYDKKWKEDMKDE